MEDDHEENTRPDHNEHHILKEGMKKMVIKIKHILNWYKSRRVGEGGGVGGGGGGPNPL